MLSLCLSRSRGVVTRISNGIPIPCNRRYKCCAVRRRWVPSGITTRRSMSLPACRSPRVADPNSRTRNGCTSSTILPTSRSIASPVAYDTELCLSGVIGLPKGNRLPLINQCFGSPHSTVMSRWRAIASETMPTVRPVYARRSDPLIGDDSSKRSVFTKALMPGLLDQSSILFDHRRPLVNMGERSTMFCFAFLYIATTGAGIWSLDALMGRGSRR